MRDRRPIVAPQIDQHQAIGLSCYQGKRFAGESMHG